MIATGRKPIDERFYLFLEALCSKDTSTRLRCHNDFYNEVWYFDPKTRRLEGSFGSAIILYGKEFEGGSYEVKTDEQGHGQIFFFDDGCNDPFYCMETVRLTLCELPENYIKNYLQHE